MKTGVLLLVLFLVCLPAKATNYYLSSLGNDLNSGTSSVSPWQSINRLNQLVYTPGDTVFFRCGDTFRGEITVSQGGNQFQRVVFTSYGTGAKPIISGASNAFTWTLNGGIYQTPVADSIANFFIANKEQTLARFPNDHQYLTLDSANTTELFDQNLTGLSTNLLAGNMCIHTAQWCWEKTTIAGVVGNQINFGAPVNLEATANYSYFLYNQLSHLDTIGEWYYDPGAQILYFKSATDPNNLSCEGSVFKNGINFMQTVSNVSVLNLRFEKQYNSGINMLNGTNRYLVIDQCEFEGQYNHGVNIKGKYTELSNSTFRGVDGIAVFVNSGGFKPEIHHNTFRSNGQYRNQGIGSEINASSIMVAFCDSSYIHHNDIDSAGYCGISVDGSYSIIERNVVKHAMMLNNDGAAYKSYGVQSHHNSWRNNFASESDGNTEGTVNANFKTPGIYFDFNVNNCIIENNTVYQQSQKGIFQNSGTNTNTIRGNIIYQTDCGIDLNGNPLQTTEITGMNIKHNVFVAHNDQSYILRQVDFSGNFNTGEIDSNYYFQPYNSTKYALRMNGMTPTDYSFQDWQLTGFDTHSTPNFVSWTYPTDDTELFINPSDTILTVDLQTAKYLDLDSNDVCGSFDLQPYTSRVLINANSSCINELEAQEVLEFARIYPNPSNDVFNITCNESSYDFSLIDLSGRTILSEQNITSKHHSFSTAEVPKGMYVVLIRTATQSHSYKVIRN